MDDAAEVHDVPMSVIKRPLQSFLDEEKVRDFMSALQVGDHDLADMVDFWLGGRDGGCRQIKMGAWLYGTLRLCALVGEG